MSKPDAQPESKPDSQERPGQQPAEQAPEKISAQLSAQQALTMMARDSERLSVIDARGRLTLTGVQVIWNAYVSLLGHELRRFMRIWKQTLVPPGITMALYFMIFGTVIGSRVGQMAGYDYVVFMLPGLMIMSVITNSYMNVSSGFHGMKFQKSIEELLVTSIPSWVILSGFVSGGVVRAMMTALIVSMVGFLFTGFYQVHNPLLLILVLLLTSTLFCLGGFINGVFSNTFDDVAIIPNFILTPLIYLGGVFYTIDLLPEPWHTISTVNPILYVVSLMRYAVLGIADVPPMRSMLALVVFILILWVIAEQLLRRGVRIRA